eukprot:1105109-Pyramimonas_sp.AAC.1
MVWSGDPFSGNGPSNRDNRPRNGAVLKGYVYQKSGEKWLKVIELQHRGGNYFMDIEFENKWLQFGETGGQPWLHST